LRAENSIIERIKKLVTTPKASKNRLPPPSLDTAKLSSLQEQAYKMVFSSAVSIITGDPGTGKTKVSATILKAAVEMGLEPIAMAPTGKAASRLGEVLEGLLKPSTIHRGLAWKATDEDNDDLGGRPRYSRLNPLPNKFVLLDEMSMADLSIMAYALDAIADDAIVVFVGDPNQLAPVSPGQPFQDFINSDVFPIVRLDEIFRQVEGSSIAFACNAIKRGNPYDFFEIAKDSKEIDIQESPNTHQTIIDLAKNSSSDLQVLTPKRDLSAILNTNLASIFNPVVSREGGRTDDLGEIPLAFNLFGKINDRVLQIKNNYFKQVFNGDQGVITSVGNHKMMLHRIKRGKKVLTYSTWPLQREIPDTQFGAGIQYSDINLPYIPEESSVEIALAYAMTIHRSQGSEWRETVLDFHPSAGNFMSRKLFFTGFSRAKRLVHLAGTAELIARAIQINRDDNRRTALAERLRNMDWNRVDLDV